MRACMFTCKQFCASFVLDTHRNPPHAQCIKIEIEIEIRIFPY